MFTYLSPTALNKTAEDVFCDALHGIYQSVACYLNAIGYRSIRPNVAWFTPVIKVRLPLRLGSHTYWRAIWADHLEGISTKSDKQYGKHLLKFIYAYVMHDFLLCCFYGTQNHSTKSMSRILFKSSKMWAMYISSPQQSIAYTERTVKELNNIQHK